jgi:2'-5' RNA ligase
MSTIRAFIASDLSDEAQRSLRAAIDDLRGDISAGAVRWTPVENIHLTLKFLGDVNPADVDGLKETLKKIAPTYPALEVKFEQLSAFPSPRRPRVIVMNLDSTQNLFDLQKQLDRATAELGYAGDEREFTPHLTLGRVSRNIGPLEFTKISRALMNHNQLQPFISTLEAVHLYRSDLLPGGAKYTRLYSALLKPLAGHPISK